MGIEGEKEVRLIDINVMYYNALMCS